MKVLKQIIAPCAIFSFLLLTFHFPVCYAETSSNQSSFPLYLEIHEDNTDNFPVAAYTEGKETLDPPFWVENGKIVYDPTLPQAIDEGKGKERFSVVIAPEKFDLNAIKLLVKHDIHYEGSSRNTDSTRYYIFNEFPATVPFDPVNINRSEINIGLEENASKLLNIRLTESSITFLYDDFSGSLRCQYGSIKSDLPKDRAWDISEKSQKISVSREISSKQYYKDPKGKGNPETTKHEFGEVEFKTKLTLKNLGSFPFAVQA